MIHSISKQLRTIFFSMTFCAVLAAGPLFAATTAEKILNSVDSKSGLIAVVGCGDAAAPEVATDLAKSGDWLVHAIATNAQELAQFNKQWNERMCEFCIHFQVEDYIAPEYFIRYFE